MDNDKPLMVTIRCITYNQEPYIRDCLEGFVMQQTNFRFEAIVHDDASTDGTAAIIKEYAEKYPDIIKPILETENQYSKHDGSLNRIMNEHTHGKYVAYCEGDDYWTDPQKLQMQVDYMELHPKCGLTYTQSKIYNQRQDSFIGTWGKDGTFEQLCKEASFVPTLTTVLRKSLLDMYNRQVENNPKFLLGDVPLWMFLMINSQTYFFAKTTGVYRELNESASHSMDFDKHTRFVNSAFTCRAFYAKEYGYVQLAREVIGINLRNLIDLSFTHNKPLRQIGLFQQMLTNCIFAPKLWLYAILSQTRIMRMIIHKERKARSGNKPK